MTQRDGERLRLGVNIDHVATVRNARGGPYPDPLRAARLAEAAGADGITAHLREDRRHITDADVAPAAALDAAAQPRDGRDRRDAGDRAPPPPARGLLVPERREERTTEGGLEVAQRREPPRPLHRAAPRRRHPRLDLHRRRPPPDRGRPPHRRPGDRAPHRRLLRGRPRRRRGRWRPTSSPASPTWRPSPPASASRSTPATA